MLQAANEAEAGCSGEVQEVEEQMAALDEELAKQGGTQLPASMAPDPSPLLIHSKVMCSSAIDVA